MASGRGWNKHRRNVGNAGIAGNVSNVCWHSSVGLQVMGLLVICCVVVSVIPIYLSHI